MLLCFKMEAPIVSGRCDVQALYIKLENMMPAWGMEEKR